MVCLIMYIIRNHVTSALAEVNGSKSYACSVLWLTPYELQQWCIRKSIETQGTWISYVAMQNLSCQQRRSSTETEKHLLLRLYKEPLSFQKVLFLQSGYIRIHQ